MTIHDAPPRRLAGRGKRVLALLGLGLLAGALWWRLTPDPRLAALLAAGDAARRDGRYDEAARDLRQCLALTEARAGANARALVPVLDDLADTLGEQGQLLEAQILVQRARQIAPGDPHAGAILSLILRAEGALADAERLARQALADADRQSPAERPLSEAEAQNALGLALRAEGKYREAAAASAEALRLREAALRPLDPDIATSANNLALIYEREGRIAEAERLLDRVIAIRERALPPDHPDLGHAYNNLAVLLQGRGDYARAERLYGKALGIERKRLGPDHPDVASDLANLGVTLRLEHKLNLAENTLRQALAIRERALPPGHPDIAATLTNLGEVYSEEGRADDSAETAFRQALSIQEKTLGAMHPDVAATLVDLGKLYRGQGRNALAEDCYRRALAIDQKIYPAGHPEIAVVLGNLGDLDTAEGKLAEAETYDQRTLAIRAAAFGKTHPLYATALDNLANLRQAQGRLAEAEALIRQVLAIRLEIFGTENQDVAGTLSNLASVLEQERRPDDALATIRRATAIYRAIPESAEEGGETPAAEAERRAARYAYADHVQILDAVYERAPATSRARLLGEAFEVSQLAQNFKVGADIQQMAARFATGTGALASLVRDEQDARKRWKQLDTALTKAALQPAGGGAGAATAGVEALRAERDRLDRTIDSLRTTIAERYPAYAAAVSREPATLASVEQLLRPDEALISYLVTDAMTFLWVVRHDGASMIRRDLSRADLDRAVAVLRAGLSPGRIAAGTGRLPVYDTGLAWRLYGQIFAPAVAASAGGASPVRHLLVVADGALTSLPPSVLVASAPMPAATGVNPNHTPDYTKVDWLVRHYAVGMLPSIGSLRALRSFAATAAAPAPFLGVGDPTLGGPRLKHRTPVAYDGVDPELIRQLVPLPETAGELGAMAQELHAGAGDVVIEADATRAHVEALPVDRYRVVAFATHGLTTDELKGLTEPALVLTPDRSRPGDNGLLRASDIMQMHFNADWVVLSACNTAAKDGTLDGESLSGLARAFFYAGTRALLVSHWPVNSLASVQLTTTAVGLSAGSGATGAGTVGKDEALRQAMLRLIDGKNPYFSHPMMWAPFVVVGESEGATP